MKRLMPALAAAPGSLPDIGCYECQSGARTMLIMR